MSSSQPLIGNPDNQDDPYYRGRKTPAHLKDGPLNDRKCTDFLCFIIFGAFWFGIITIAGTALAKGNPTQMMYPWDSQGNPCGNTNDTEGYPYLFWYADASDDYAINQTVCVNACPTSSSNFTDSSCAPDYTSTNPQLSCDRLESYPTTQLEYFCLPVDTDILNSLTGGTGLDFGFTFQAIADLKTVWWMIIVVGIIALVLGFIYLLLMKYFAGVIVWSLLVIWLVVWGAFGFICIEDAMGADLENITPKALIGLDPVWLNVIGGICILVTVISLILVCCFRTRINLAIAVMKAAADYLEDEKGILLVPPFFLITNTAFYIFWIITAVYIFSMNTLVADETNFPAPDVQWSTETIVMFAYHIVALFWNHAFAVSLSQFIIASSVCLWYFNQGKSNVESGTIWTSVKRSFLHLGSIALGSFIIATVEIVKFVFEYISKKIKKDNPLGSADSKVGFCLACCGCFLACFEKSLKFVSRHAYIQIAMTGENFCQAAEDAFHLLLRNALRFGTVHGLAAVFTFLGQVVVSLGATFIGYCIIRYSDYFQDHIYSFFLPGLLFFLSSLSVAHVFMAVYGTSADTIIHCFAMDDEIHDGEPKHAPKELRDFIENHAGVSKLTLNEY